MILIRKTIAIGALLALGGLIVTLDRGAYGVNPGLVVATKLLLVPLGATIIGLAAEQYWGRWLGLAAAVAVLPWALYLTFGLPPGVPLMQQTIALVASALLLVTLCGRTMFERYEGRATTDWSGLRMGLVRWTLILNLASAVGLFVFVSVYRYQVEWHVAVPAGVFFVWKEPSWAGGAHIFAASFVPGVLAGWACLIAFGKPVWQAMRSE